MSASAPPSVRVARLRHPQLANLLLALTSLVVCLLVLELGARLFASRLRPTQRLVYDVDLSTGISFLPGRKRVYETSEYRYTLATNRFGRRDREWSEAELADPGNLLFIGDSFVMGSGVEDEAAIPTRLEAFTRANGMPREVFNFGMPATGLAQYIQLFEEALRIGVKARTVLVGIFIGNDFEMEYVGPPPEALPPVGAAPPRFMPHSVLFDFLRMRVSDSTRLVGWMLQLSDWFGVRVYNTSSSYIFLRKQPPEQEKAFDLLLGELSDLKERSFRHDRDLYFVVFPNRIQVENRESLTNSVYDAERPNRRIEEYCERNGLRCLDLLPALSQVFARERQPLYFSVDRHLNVAGTRAAAESIRSWLGQEHALASFAPAFAPSASAPPAG